MERESRETVPGRRRLLLTPVLAPPQTTLSASRARFGAAFERAVPVVHVLGFAIVLLAAAMAVPFAVAIWFFVKRGRRADVIESAR